MLWWTAQGLDPFARAFVLKALPTFRNLKFSQQVFAVYMMWSLSDLNKDFKEIMKRDSQDAMFAWASFNFKRCAQVTKYAKGHGTNEASAEAASAKGFTEQSCALLDENFSVGELKQA